jgi:acetoin utilization deacetylase AcuC-like enzyme
VQAFQPDAIVVACGFDASGTDPLGRMMAGSDTFQALTEMDDAGGGRLCDGRLTLVHEGGYSEVHVPFCGHATIAALARSSIRPRTRCNPASRAQQPGERFQRYCSVLIAEMEDALGY